MATGQKWSRCIDVHWDVPQAPCAGWDVAGEVVFFHCRIGPDKFHQLIFLYDSVAILNQD
jgi:hypothetical protein